MLMEAALLESRTLRSGLCERTDALDEVKALVLLPDGLHATTRMVADYFDVGREAVHHLLSRHREELRSNGYTVVEPVDAPLARSRGGGRGIALYSRRAVLNVAMLLRGSEVARQVRRRLLDAVEAALLPAVEPPVVHAFRARPWKRWDEPGWDELRWDEDEAGPVVPSYAEEPVPLAAIGERIDRQEAWLAGVDARLEGLGEDVRAIRRDVAHLRGRRRRRT